MLAEEARIALRTLQDIERNKREPRIQTIQNIAEALSISEDAIIDGNNEHLCRDCVRRNS